MATRLSSTTWFGTPHRSMMGSISNSHILLGLFILLIGLQYTYSQLYNSVPNLNTFYGSGPRRWIVSGNFSSITVNTTTYNNLNNIAVWNGTSWKGLGNGTNGLIRTSYVDTCFNMYIGGDFSTAGGVNTGPIARWSIPLRRWEGFSHNITWAKNSSIRSITVDCFNTPSEISKCSCNVWMAGNFEIVLSDGQDKAINLAMYQVHTDTWFSLRNDSDHNLTRSMTVNTVLKRDLGQTFHSRKTFFGGDFPFILTWDPYYKIWENIPLLDPNASVSHIHFHKAVLDSSFFDLWNYVISGSFNFESNATDSNSTILCNNICMLHFRDSNWIEVPDSDLITGPVSRVSTTDEHIYMVGDIVGSDFNYLAAVNVSGLNSALVNSTSVTTSGFNDVYACKLVDLDCALGSLGLVDKDGAVWFFDSDTKTYHQFGQVNPYGIVQSITSVYLYFLSDFM